MGIFSLAGALRQGGGVVFETAVRDRGGDYGPLDGEGELVAARHALRDDVLISYPCGCEGLLGAGDERINDGGVPPRVNYGDTQRGA